MNTLKTLLIVLVLNFGFSIQANAGFLTGNKYRQAPEEIKTGYIMGTVDSIGALSGWGDLTTPHILNINTCTKGMPADQIVAIVDKYLESNPEKWHFDMTSLTLNAIIQACEK